ncbi:MAG: hypothetical protein AAFY41_10030 [Bacteroidota bacterium]
MRTKLFTLLLAFAGIASAQNNLQNFTPSILFKKGDWEFKTFQNYYTQTKAFNSSGNKEGICIRETFFTSINQFLYGVNDQINVGFDVWEKASNRTEDEFDTSWGLTGIGPKIKIAPFKDLPRLSIQSTFLFKVATSISTFRVVC